MNKKNILEMSRQENKNKDLVGRNAELKASMIAGISMAVLSLVFYAAQIALQGNCNWGLFAIITFYNAVMNIVRGIKISKKGVIIAGVIWLLLTIALSVAHIGTLIETSTIL
jgi:hypothetical protein